jgi:hypothetical protein
LVKDLCLKPQNLDLLILDKARKEKILEEAKLIYG